MTDGIVTGGFWQLDAYTNGNQIVVFGHPFYGEKDGAQHSCDQMGCPSIGAHIVARIPVMQPTPELSWCGAGQGKGVVLRLATEEEE